MRPRANAAWAMYCEAPPHAMQANLGLAIAKKLAKRAVDRNALKRMSREWARSEVGLGRANDCVIKLRHKVGTKTHGRLREQERILLRAKLVELGQG